MSHILKMLDTHNVKALTDGQLVHVNFGGHMHSNKCIPLQCMLSY